MFNPDDRSNGDDDNAWERRHNPGDPDNCICQVCLLHRQYQHRQAILAHLPDQPSGPSHSEHPSISATTPRSPAGQRPSRPLPMLAESLNRNPSTHSILSQIDTTAGSDLYRAITLGSQYGLPDIQNYAESGAQNEHAQPGSSRPAQICITPVNSLDISQHQQSPYPTQERDGQNRHTPLLHPTRRSLDRGRYSQPPHRSNGGNANLYLRGVSPVPTGFPPDIRHDIGSDGQNEYAQREDFRHVPAGPPPVLQQYRGLDGRSGFAQLGYSTPTRLSPTTTAQTPEDSAVIKSEEDDDYSLIENEEEEEDGFVIESEED